MAVTSVSYPSVQFDNYEVLGGAAFEIFMYACYENPRHVRLVSKAFRRFIDEYVLKEALPKLWLSPLTSRPTLKIIYDEMTFLLGEQSTLLERIKLVLGTVCDWKYSKSGPSAKDSHVINLSSKSLAGDLENTVKDMFSDEILDEFTNQIQELRKRDKHSHLLAAPELSSSSPKVNDLRAAINEVSSASDFFSPKRKCPILPQIARLKNLSHFHEESGPITEPKSKFPRFFSRAFWLLTNLQTIDIIYPVLKLPSEIGRLQNLRKLTICLQGDIPDELGNCKALKWLNISCPKDRQQVPLKLPSSLGKLQNLESIILRNFSNFSLPEELKNCTKLESFEIEKLVEGKVPADIGNCTALKQLRISSSELGGKTRQKPLELPSSLGQLQNLEKIILERFYNITLPEELKYCTKLQEVAFRTCRLKKFPHWIWNSTTAGEIWKGFKEGNPYKYLMPEEYYTFKLEKKNSYPWLLKTFAWSLEYWGLCFLLIICAITVVAVDKLESRSK